MSYVNARTGHEERVGPYLIVEELLGGGMGRVHLALAPHGERVVLKRPLKDGGPAGARRIRREATLGFQHRHRHLVRTRELFETHEGPVLVLEHVDGPSLRAMRRLGPMPLGAVARVGHQTARALAALHDAARPALHRDVAPGNILVDEGAEVRVIDLGVALPTTALTPDNRPAGEGDKLIGTVRFLAPEVLDVRRYSPASEVWALGVVLLEAALGRSTAPEGYQQALLNAMQGTVMQLLPHESLPPVLHGLLTRMLAQRPSARPTLAEVDAVLREVEARSDDGEGALRALRARARTLPPVPLTPPFGVPVPAAAPHTQTMPTLPAVSPLHDDATAEVPAPIAGIGRSVADTQEGTVEYDLRAYAARLRAESITAAALGAGRAPTMTS